MRDFKYLLLFRWMVINIVGLFLLGVTYVYGGVDLILVADQTYLSVLIFAVFLYGLVVSGIKIFQTSREINLIKSDKRHTSKWFNFVSELQYKIVDSTKIIETLKLKLFSKITTIKWIANSLVLLGLIGTVVGFIITLSGVDPSLVSDVTVISKMVSVLISGLGTALYTTLVGSVLNLWLSGNYLLLSEGTSTLMAVLLENSDV